MLAQIGQTEVSTLVPRTLLRTRPPPDIMAFMQEWLRGRLDGLGGDGEVYAPYLLSVLEDSDDARWRGPPRGAWRGPRQHARCKSREEHKLPRMLSPLPPLPGLMLPTLAPASATPCPAVYAALATCCATFSTACSRATRPTLPR